MKRFRDRAKVALEIRDRLLIREHVREQEAIPRLEPLMESMAHFQRINIRLAKCHQKDLFGAARRVRQNVMGALRDLRREVDLLASQLNVESPVLPTAQEIIADLDQIEREFPSWRFEGNRNNLIIVTDPIELEGIYLGRFEIQVDVNDLGNPSRRQPFLILALEPNLAQANEKVTHPHVSDAELCTGDATSAIEAALAAGRIGDFALLVRSVLTTYNADSPYAKLEEWHGRPCAECGYSVAEEHAFWCDTCEQEYCGDCFSCCQCCDQGMCLACLGTCDSCEEPTCRRCLHRCAVCDESCCKSCLKIDLCRKCAETKEKSHETKQDRKEQVPTRNSCEALIKSRI